MSIDGLVRDYGVNPSIVRMLSSDSYATITSAGYLKSRMADFNRINGGAFQWNSSDMILCYYLTGWQFFTLNSDMSSLIPFINPSTGAVSNGLINQLGYYASSGDVISGLSTANNGLLVTSSSGIPSIGNTIGADIIVHDVTVGQGGFADSFGSNLAIGNSALANNVSGINNCAFGYASLKGVITTNNNIGLGVLAGLSNDGTNNIYIGFSSGELLGTTSFGDDNTLVGGNTGTGGGNSSGSDLLGGSSNTWIGNFVTGSNTVTSGTIGIGKWATPDPTTGSGVGAAGPGIAIGASSFPVGFRGDGSAYPAGSANYWRMKINDTYYKLPILPDNTTITWPASGVLASTSNVVVLAPSGDQTITGGYSLVVADTGNVQASAGNLIAGSAGSRGHVFVYPPTSGMGVVEIAAADSAAMYIGLIINDVLNANRTWTLPDASGTVALTSQLPSSGTPLTALNGGTGISNSFNLTVSAASSINQNVSTGATPTFVSLITAPAVSSSSSLIVGTAYQNTLGYDVVITVYLAISAATAADILLGVGPTNTPTQQTIISGLTLASLGVVPVNIYLPNNYYALLSTSGTITQTISGQLAMPV